MLTSVEMQTPEALTQLLVDRSHCDARAIERARQIALQTGKPPEAVLIQLGLLTERALAEAYAELLELPIADASRYPSEAPLLPDRLPARFLRQARSLPVAVNDDVVVLATADPLDKFTSAAVASATGRRVELLVAIPIELEAALERLYPSEDPRHRWSGTG